jgi:hypothetical protein
MNNEPVAWLIQTKTAHQFTFKEPTIIPLDAVVIPLYTHPVKELTDEEIEEVIKNSKVKISGLEAYDYCYPQNYRLDEKMFARAILRKAQEKC